MEPTHQGASGPDKNVFDSTVLITPTATYLWSGPDGAHFASSEDGLTFKDKGPFKFGDQLFVTWAAAIDVTHWFMDYLLILL